MDEYYHFNVNLTDSVFTHNTATGQLIGGGVACIRNASINIIRSTFKHNYADLHGGVFYIDESATSVDGSLFVNNSAAVDGGVFYTYVHDQTTTSEEASSASTQLEMMEECYSLDE